MTYHKHSGLINDILVIDRVEAYNVQYNMGGGGIIKYRLFNYAMVEVNNRCFLIKKNIH